MRKNPKLRKALTLILCAVALVAISVGATIAYLTDHESVKNTFTVGHVDIDLTEAPVDENGQETTGDRINGSNAQTLPGNQYHLIPGETYDKDPTITVKPGSEDCYVAAKVVVSGAKDSPLYNNEWKLLDITNVVTGGVVGAIGEMSYQGNGTNHVWDADDYKITQIEENDSFVIMVYFKDYVAKTATERDLVLFEELKVPSDWTNAQIQTLKDLEIEVTAYAMQKSGFATYDKAFENFESIVWEDYTHNP